MNILQTAIKITSRDNAQYKQALKLQTPQGRRKSSSFLVEGFKLAQEAIKAGLSISQVFLMEDTSEKAQATQEEILIGLGDARVYMLEQSLFKALSQASTPEPIILVADQPKLDVKVGGPMVVLDGIQDPGNLGTIARSARAFGFSALLTLNSSVSPYHPKALRASMGAVFTLPYHQLDPDLMQQFKDQGYVVYAADLDGQSFDQVSFSDKSLLIIGNEANGLSNKAKTWTDAWVTIPMEVDCESLNAGVAASIIMQQVYRSLKAQ